MVEFHTFQLRVQTLFSVAPEFQVFVTGATLFAFHFTVILLSRVNDKDEQQVCGCMVVSGLI